MLTHYLINKQKLVLIFLLFVTSVVGGAFSAIIRPIYTFSTIIGIIFVYLIFTRYRLVIVCWFYISVLLFQISQFSSDILDIIRWILMVCACLIVVIFIKNDNLKYNRV